LGRHPVDQSSYLWAKSSLANYILRTLGDGTEMAHSIEGRLPFLDHLFVSFAKGLPVQSKIYKGVEKHILREALRAVVPATVRMRSKHPFTAPPLSLFKGGAFIQEILRSRSFSRVYFFDVKRVIALLDRLPSLEHRERIAWDPVVMLILSACLMQECFKL
jgi:asparagine synthase (glutamine-hydrolysing)